MQPGAARLMLSVSRDILGEEAGSGLRFRDDQRGDPQVYNHASEE